ncbi:SH3-domain-containing protein, partial [Ramicandelaber brevisporus]
MSFFVRALYDFTGEEQSALAFRGGDVIEVMQTLPSGWWNGICRGSRGWFPSNFV